MLVPQYIVRESSRVSSLLKEKLDILKRVSERIDVSRASIQLDILLLLATNSEELTIHEISSKLNRRYKSVADALRKMINKGLVRKHCNIFVLSDEGKILYDTLVSLLEVNRINNRRLKVNAHRDVRDIVHNVITINHLYNVLIALGAVKEKTLDLKTLSKIMGLCVKRAQLYLDLFTQHPFNILHKVYIKKPTNKLKNIILQLTSSLFSKNKSKYNNIHYTLTGKGVRIYNRLLHRPLIKNSDKRLYCILLTLFNTLHPRILIKRLTMLTSFVLTVTSSYIVLSLIKCFDIMMRRIFGLISLILCLMLMLIFIILYKVYR